MTWEFWLDDGRVPIILVYTYTCTKRVTQWRKYHFDTKNLFSTELLCTSYSLRNAWEKKPVFGIQHTWQKIQERSYYINGQSVYFYKKKWWHVFKGIWIILWEEEKILLQYFTIPLKKKKKISCTLLDIFKRTLVVWK